MNIENPKEFCNELKNELSETLNKMSIYKYQLFFYILVKQLGNEILKTHCLQKHQIISIIHTMEIKGKCENPLH